MLKFGIVESIQSPHVIVKFNDADGMKSYPLAVMKPFTKGDKASWTMNIGTQVACLMDENSEEGVVLGAMYSDADMPLINDANKFQISFEDGAILEYDKQAHKLTADVSGIIDLKCTQVLINGKDLIAVHDGHKHPTPNGTSGTPDLRLS